MQKNLIALALLLSLAFATNDVDHYKGSTHSCLPRKKAPFFSANAVLHGKFSRVSLNDFEGKYLVILFYPFDFTYVCPTELIAFSDNAQKFRDTGAEVIAISTDSHFTHLAWTKTPRIEGGVGDLNIPLLADISKSISRNYGVLVEDPLDELYGAALRGLYILDGNGVVRSVQVNDAPVGRSVEEAMRLIQAFQYTDKHGEVCPANWKPGEATIKPDQDLKKEFFEKKYKHDL
jgi:peroxiredoxin (alkyl hydroperoxide reductase subunit C)